jgi:DNA repair exonuclease SbcCD nuclease subunit
MAKVLLFSDIHIHNHKKSYDRLEDCLKALEWVFETAKKENIKNILFGGDILHERQKIDIFVYNKIYNSLSENLKDSDINFYCLLGNHDLWFNEKTTISGVYPFQSIQGFKVISNPETIQIDDSEWDFLPFTHDPIESLKTFNKKNIKNRFLLGHISIDGAYLNSGSVSDVIVEHDGEMVKVSKEIFSNYKHSFFGHYHKSQNLTDNVEYIGSPLELSFGESEEEKHIIIFDTSDCSKKYIINDFSPKHIYIK